MALGYSLFMFLFFPLMVVGQEGFVSTNGSQFYLKEKPMNFIGINAYYLQSSYSDESKRHIIEDVFKLADKYDIDVIRTWGFNESAGESQIMSGPYRVSESGLISLDYILYLAGLYDIKIILCLANYHGDFGGIPRYIAWADSLPGGENFKLSDFFIDDSVKSWYKFYVSTLLNRVNSYTGVRYANDENIFSFELINEAVCQDYGHEILYQWYDEMSRYFKSIDANHLLSTGESGYDLYYHQYSDINLFYDGSMFILNGTKGSSYYINSGLETIDYASYHLYPSGWRISPVAGKTWIRDHVRIARRMNKPSLLGEFGALKKKHFLINEYLQVLYETNSRSAILWQYAHPDLTGCDEFGFNEISDPELFEILSEYITKIKSEPSNSSDPPGFNILRQNFPNPFNPSTRIIYHLNRAEYVTLKLYNIIGEEVGILDEGFREAGDHVLDLSFQDSFLSSGIYIYELRAGESAQRKKLVLLK